MINHARGGSPAVFNFVIKHCGYYGLFALPFVGLTLEKSFYDTAVGVPALDAFLGLASNGRFSVYAPV
jgi:hypothetical protein